MSSITIASNGHVSNSEYQDLYTDDSCATRCWFTAFAEKGAAAFDCKNAFMLRFAKRMPEPWPGPDAQPVFVPVPLTIRVRDVGLDVDVPPWSPETGFALLKTRGYSVYSGDVLLFRTKPAQAYETIALVDTLNANPPGRRRMLMGEE